MKRRITIFNTMQSITIEDLKKVVALSDLPDEHLQWMLDRCEYDEYEDGTQIVKYGEPIDWMWILLEGKALFYMDVNGKQVYYYAFENDNETGGIGGSLPYSRMKASPGYTYASGKVRFLRFHKKHFQELERLNPDFIQRLIGYMSDRARAFATMKLQHEKVNALGKLAAGIAHELNNPAAAISRIASELTKRLNHNYELTEKLLQCNMVPQHIDSIRILVEKKKKESEQKLKLSAMQLMEYEEGIEEWLANQGVTNKEAAETFAEFRLTVEELEKIRNDVGKNAFPNVILWLENLLSSQKIIEDLNDASSHISTLVGAIKSHVHMDRTNDLQPTDIHKDIENALTLLGFKLREKNIEVKKKFCDDLPVVPAYIGELNQVWSNIIDNAIHAISENGELTIQTECNSKDIKVHMIDNGSGIPPEIVSRIFDPFFTTKNVGEGTGIGLDTVNRIIKHHNGEIKVNSVPGRTEFQICIPRQQNKERDKNDVE